MDLLSKLLKDMVTTNASDLFLSTGQSPAFRINGKLHLHNSSRLATGRIHEMVKLLLQEEQIEAFEINPEMNVSCSIPGIGRFRFNIFRQKNETAMVIRAVPSQIPEFNNLGLPEALQEIVMAKRGLVLVVGPSGAGKSTTLATMIEHRNCNDVSHIITIEDPIEYIIEHKRSLVNQRQLGNDTQSYHNALINALRQSPDVIMIGEIRDVSVMEDVLEFADTGHLCLATLHANNAPQALDRIIHMFPQDQREQLCIALSQNITAVASQILVPTVDGHRIAAVELMVSTPRIKDLIARGKFDDIHETLEKDTSSNMCSMDQSLYKLYCEGRITEETALVYANSVSNMRLQIRLSTRDNKSAAARDTSATSESPSRENPSQAQRQSNAQRGGQSAHKSNMIANQVRSASTNRMTMQRNKAPVTS